LSLVGIWTGIPDFQCPYFDGPGFDCPDFDCAIYASVGKITVTELQLGGGKIRRERGEGSRYLEREPFLFLHTYSPLARKARKKGKWGVREGRKGKVGKEKGGRS